MDHVIRVMMVPSIITKDAPRQEPEVCVQRNRQPICPRVEGRARVACLGYIINKRRPAEWLRITPPSGQFVKYVTSVNIA